ncbi:MAG: hypothetical protein IJ593_10680 [Lachnospiraceae bacterium]|nr:hypothetical protein [Lachnospiraceae bacterium]
MKTFKRALSIILVLMMILSLSSCAKEVVSEIVNNVVNKVDDTPVNHSSSSNSSSSSTSEDDEYSEYIHNLESYRLEDLYNLVTTDSRFTIRPVSEIEYTVDEYDNYDVELNDAEKIYYTYILYNAIKNLDKETLDKYSDGTLWFNDNEINEIKNSVRMFNYYKNVICDAEAFYDLNYDGFDYVISIHKSREHAKILLMNEVVYSLDIEHNEFDASRAVSFSSDSYKEYYYYSTVDEMLDEIGIYLESAAYTVNSFNIEYWASIKDGELKFDISSIARELFGIDSFGLVSTIINEPLYAYEYEELFDNYDKYIETRTLTVDDIFDNATRQDFTDYISAYTNVYDYYSEPENREKLQKFVNENIRWSYDGHNKMYASTNIKNIRSYNEIIDIDDIKVYLYGISLLDDEGIYIETLDKLLNLLDDFSAEYLESYGLKRPMDVDDAYNTLEPLSAD